MLLVGLLPLTACSHSDPGAYYGTTDDIVSLINQNLHRRTRALDEDDLGAFQRTVGAGAIGRQQHMYFGNIQNLPIQTLSYRIVADSLTPGPSEGSYWVEIRTTTELRGYDDKPIASYDHWLFRPTTNGQRYVLVSTTDKAWENSHDTATQPWEVEHVYVDEYGSVLGIFDSRTAAHAGRLMRTLSEGKDDVSLTIPEDEQPSTGWGTLVYVLSDQTIINGLSGETVGDPDRADGLTMALPADVDDPAKGTASYRIAINPRVLSEPASVIGRLVRHEMTHATLGPRGRGAPLWLTEGIAEWVSVRPMPRSQRRLPASAMSVGLSAQSLPTSADFGGTDAEGWYAVSWWVCEYIANTYGAHTLWTLLDQLSGGADQDQVVQDLLQITPDVLVRRGVALMSATYGS